MNYIAQLNAFDDSNRAIGLPSFSQVIYYKLVGINNRVQWAETFMVTNQRLMFEAGISNEKTLIRYRNILKQYGFIEFVSGRKGQPTKYHLPILYEERGNTVLNTVKNAGEKIYTVPDTVKDTGYTTVKQPVKRTVNRTAINKHKQETKTEKEKRKEKAGAFSLEVYTQNPELIDALKGFIEMRKQGKSPLTERAFTLALSQLDKLGRSDAEKIAIVNQTVMNGWKGFYALKQEVKQRGNTGINRRTSQDADRYADFREADKRQVYPWEVQSQPGSAGAVSGIHSPGGGGAGEVPELPGEVLAGGEPQRGDPCPDDCGGSGNGSRGNMPMGATTPGTGADQPACPIGQGADGLRAGHLSGLLPDAGEYSGG